MVQPNFSNHSWFVLLFDTGNCPPIVCARKSDCEECGAWPGLSFCQQWAMFVPPGILVTMFTPDMAAWSLVTNTEAEGKWKSCYFLNLIIISMAGMTSAATRDACCPKVNKVNPLLRLLSELHPVCTLQEDEWCWLTFRSHPRDNLHERLSFSVLSCRQLAITASTKLLSLLWACYYHEFLPRPNTANTWTQRLMESAGGWSAVCSQVFTPGHQTEAILCPAFRVLIDRHGSGGKSSFKS